MTNFKCYNCKSEATWKIWEAYFGYRYYCTKCKQEQTMDDK